jgi:hypothetical protein
MNIDYSFWTVVAALASGLLLAVVTKMVLGSNRTSFQVAVIVAAFAIAVFSTAMVGPSRPSPSPNPPGPQPRPPAPRPGPVIVPRSPEETITFIDGQNETVLDGEVMVRFLGSNDGFTALVNLRVEGRQYVKEPLPKGTPRQFGDVIVTLSDLRRVRSFHQGVLTFQRAN